ncbi:MAG: enoyl-CoA hydratase/isomerase family protein [Planctomycetes bacterium]|nr:enoyl-CoA hydratase/isomerase family protein [Planctomycetota bacterium]
MSAPVRVEHEGPVATIVLSRPEVRNAINLEMVEGIHHALAALEPREDVHALVIRGEGGKAFASGADIAELRERRRDDAWRAINGTLFARVERFPRPTVASITGFCLGGGCELALACDFRVAGASSRFGQPEVTLGIMAAAGGTRRLPALVGLAHARRLLFGGTVIDAAEALRIGLVDRVVPDEQVPAAVAALLAPILSAAPEAVRWTKAAMLLWAHGGTEDALARLDREAQGLLFEHPDKFARMDAFLARRKASASPGG